jgi:tryptophan halogenase
LRAWNKNVVAIGLAAGFIEPLESTSIHLAISGVVRLIHMFPSQGIADSLAERYNRASRLEMEHVRDFIILHYHANLRDEDMWRDCRGMTLPDGLAERIRLFRDRAHVWQGEDELFRLDSWTHVMTGQGIMPADYHPVARALPDADMRRLFDAIRKPINAAVQSMPSHQAFLEQYCPADSSVWHRFKPTAAAQRSG